MTYQPCTVFRTDASIEIGTGHVMRCLTLADELRARGVECLFVCRLHTGHLIDEIARRGHRALALPDLPPNSANETGGPAHASWLGTDWARDARETLEVISERHADWLIVDHYALDSRWESALRAAVRHIMVMDDLADRKHDCDLLLDPTLGRTEADYNRLIPARARTLLGPRYALLRPEFAALRSESLARRKTPELRHLLITMGGVDKDNITGSVLDALDACPLGADTRITAVMGRHSPRLDDVKARAGSMKFQTEVQVGVRNMARLMTDSDLAIGAGGGTSWERCCMGLPTFVLSLAENQFEMARSLEAAEAVLATGTTRELARRLTGLLETRAMGTFLAKSSAAAAQITDGLGVERACRALQA